MNDKLNTPIQWCIWGLITGFLFWVLTSVIKAIVMLLVGQLAPIFALLVIPAAAINIWLLDGCIRLGVKSWS